MPLLIDQCYISQVKIFLHPMTLQSTTYLYIEQQRIHYPWSATFHKNNKLEPINSYWIPWPSVLSSFGKHLISFIINDINYISTNSPSLSVSSHEQQGSFDMCVNFLFFYYISLNFFFLPLFFVQILMMLLIHLHINLLSKKSILEVILSDQCIYNIIKIIIIMMHLLFSYHTYTINHTHIFLSDNHNKLWISQFSHVKWYIFMYPMQSHKILDIGGNIIWSVHLQHNKNYYNHNAFNVFPSYIYNKSHSYFNSIKPEQSG